MPRDQLGLSGIVSIPVRPPYPWQATLRYLTPRLTPGIETIDSEKYVRRTPGGGVSVEYDAAAQALRCSVDGSRAPADWPARVQQLFDTSHDPGPTDRALRASPVLQRRVRALPGVRAPGCWAPFELCLRVILGQQVSVKAAHTLMGRLVALCPGLDPEKLLETDIGTVGLPGRRLQTVRRLAERVAAGGIRFDQQPWDEVAAQLAEVPGFGPWTLQYLGIRLGRDADAFPEQDLGLMRATGAATPRELRRPGASLREI